jgi:DNA-binding transcriptional MerR regulator/methylmalonyl-CoA mutase cobalamin-binding subunit
LNRSIDTLSIAAVERDTGLAKDTLRAWERRYGFPQPRRDAQGERAYPLAQVEKLRVLKQLVDAGHRPGQVAPLPVERLRRLAAAGQSAPAPAVAPGTDVGALLVLIVQHRTDELRRELAQTLLRLGLARALEQVIVPLIARVGEAWSRGELQVSEEHLFSELVQSLLRQAIGGIPAPADGARPRVLLTTLPREQHGLGLLMAEAMLVLAGARCVSLGVQTPVADIVRAAAAQRADIVALSFTSVMAARQVLDGLAELRRALPVAVEIWAGGGAAALRSRRDVPARVLASLAEVAPAVEQWRAAHAP